MSRATLQPPRQARVRLLPALGALAGLSLAVTLGALGGALGPLMMPAQAEATKPAPAKAVTPPPVSRPPAPASRSEVELVNDLANRRKALDEQARKLDLRERLLDAAEKRLDAKMAELRQLDASIKAQSAVRDEQTNKQLASLVKMYETMKPKDAARIFERLDLPVQLSVATRMKEAKMAAIMADMSPEAAKVLTTALAGRARATAEKEPQPINLNAQKG